MVSAPMVRASPGAWSQNLWSCQSNSFECMRYDRQVRFGLPHAEHTPSRRRIDQEWFGCANGPAPHVTSLAQSMVSAPMVRASPGAWSQNLWSCQSNSFECMRYDRQVRFGLPHAEHTPSRRRIDQEWFDCVE